MRAAILLLLAGTGLTARGDDLAFRPAEQAGAYQFDTGALEGRLHFSGASQGIDRLVEVRSGVDVAHGGGHPGLFSPYRLFSTARRYGHGARDWPSQTALRSDGALEVVWPAGDDHPLVLAARFRWSAPDTLDAEWSATPQVAMPAFEFFLSSYFADGFDASVYVRPNYFQGGEAALLPADVNPLVDGTYLIFPRDRQAAAMIFDGRWELPPNPVQWSVTRLLAGPLGVRRHAPSGVTALVMGQPDGCFAVSTPYNKTPPDGVAGHRSLYLSLFGRDLAAGETARARTRLVVAKLSDAESVGRYEQFAQEK